jgi:hypothetical protein
VVLINWILRVLLVLFVVRLVLRWLSRLGSTTTSRSGPRRQAGRLTREGGHLVRDPQCGTYVSVNRALREGSGAQAVYFCSEACRGAWLARKTS